MLVCQCLCVRVRSDKSKTLNPSSPFFVWERDYGKKKEREKETRRDGVIVKTDKCGLSRDKQQVNTHNNQSQILLTMLNIIAFWVCLCMCLCLGGSGYALLTFRLNYIPHISSRHKLFWQLTQLCGFQSADLTITVTTSCLTHALALCLIRVCDAACVQYENCTF